MELTSEHIEKLNDVDLRSLVEMLCQAELRRNGHAESAVLAGGRQTAKDGGVDVAVRLQELGKPLDFIPRAHADYQVKCTDMAPADIEKEMRPDGVLRSVIKDAVAAEGAYVIVSSRGTIAHGPLLKRLEAMADAVAGEANHGKLFVDFYDRVRLARWVRQYPGVELWVRDRVNDRLQGWQGYGAWAKGELGSKYLHDEHARLIERTGGGSPATLSIPDGLDRLRLLLELPGQIARLVGLSGTGKTRFVQALLEDGVGVRRPIDRAIVRYTDMGDEPVPGAREMLLQLGASEQRTIVIIDNCKPSLHQSLAQVVSKYKAHLSLLTVEYDVTDDGQAESTDVFKLEPASDSVIGRILESLVPGLNYFDRNRIADFSGGNARIALALARTVETGESIGTLTDDELFRRLFRQGQADNDELLRAAEVCSLVYSFDGEDVTAKEHLSTLGGLVEMTPMTLSRHVGTLRERDLIQVRSRWRALLPHAVANRLAKRALRNIPNSEIVKVFLSSEWLLRSFCRRLNYLQDSSEARAIASTWITHSAWLGKFAELDDYKRQLLSSLAPLAPEAVLSTLEFAMNGLEKDRFFFEQKGGFSYWSELLRQLAYDPEMFGRAATLLHALAAVAGPDSNAGTDWKELFRIELSGTRAPPEQRASFLRPLFLSPDGISADLAYDALGAMLGLDYFSSSHNFEFGGRTDGYGWAPESANDFRGWLASTFGLALEVASAGPRQKLRVGGVIANNFRGLWLCGCFEPVEEMMRAFADESGWPAGWVACRTSLAYDTDPSRPGDVERLKALADALQPKGLIQEVRTFAIGHGATHLDIEDAVQDLNGEAPTVSSVMSAQTLVHEKVIELGAKLSEDDALLNVLLPELLTTTTGRQGALGIGLARGTKRALEHWQQLADAFRKVAEPINPLLLNGFVQGLFEKGDPTAFDILRNVEADPALDGFYPNLLGGPRDDEDGDRLIACIRRGVAAAVYFRVRTDYRGGDGLSVQKYCEVLEELCELPNGLECAIGLLSFELVHQRSSREEPPQELRSLGCLLLTRERLPAGGPAVSWGVHQVVEAVLGWPGHDTLASHLAQQLAESMARERRLDEDHAELARILLKLRPHPTLNELFQQTLSERRRLFRPLGTRRNESIFADVSQETLLDWGREAPAQRAPRIAEHICIYQKESDETYRLSALAEGLLKLCEEKSDLLAGFACHFTPTMWFGKLRNLLSPFVGLMNTLETHEDHVVAAWAKAARERIQERILNDRVVERQEEQAFE